MNDSANPGARQHMDAQNVRLAIEDGVAVLTIDRPKALNALDHRTLQEIDAAVAQVGADAAVRVLIVTGAGEKAFVAGADIKQLQENSPAEAAVHSAYGQRVFDHIEGLGKPSIAAINGFALGGGLELALACTLRIASANAKMGLPEITLGLIPGFGGTQRLPRLIGTAQALHMILTGQMIDASEAKAVGLVSAVTEPESLLDTARDLAKRLRAFSPVTLKLAEESVRHGREMSFADALAYEAAQFGVANATEDAREGMAAFVEKRKAEFRGR